MLEYAEHGEIESMLARAYIADAVSELAARLVGRTATWGSGLDALAPAMPFVEEHRSPAFLAALGDQVAVHGTGPSHLSDDFELVAETFRRFADDRIRPVAEHVHRTNADVPEELISGLAELGAFGLSVPEEYDGFASGGEHDSLGMVVSTEELSRGSLGIGGSLITRPEILTRALLTGGTDEQKQRWLPRIASGELMAGIMVTEPDYGSDVAGIGVSATPTEGGYRINGVKTWATFAGRADVIMLLARTDPDRSAGHRGLSVFVIEKEPTEGHSFRFRAGRRRQARRPRDRHHRLPRHALVRGVVLRLVRAGREPRRARRGTRPRLLSADGRLRERAAPNRGARSGSCRPRSKPAWRTRATATSSAARSSTTSSRR